MHLTAALLTARARTKEIHRPRLVLLLESNLVGVMAEASTAHVETVLADQTVMVAADSDLTGTGSVLLGVRKSNVLVSNSWELESRRCRYREELGLVAPERSRICR